MKKLIDLLNAGLLSIGLLMIMLTAHQIISEKITVLTFINFGIAVYAFWSVLKDYENRFGSE